MNQILVTKKLYITPELKRKKKVYKVYFFLSVFLLCILISLYIYAEYDRNKSEETAAALLEEFNQETEDMNNKKKVLVAVLDGAEEEQNIPPQIETETQSNINQNKKIKTENGYTYSKIGSVSIPKINVNYTIIDGETDSVEETDALLKISPTKFWGPDPNTVGNFCVVGHNYRNTKFFSKVPTLQNGDIIEITDSSNKTVKYSVYANYQVEPSDISCIDQATNGKREVTLITCTNDSKLRVIVKAREI